MQNNKLNKEEQAFQDKINQMSFSYQEADWKAMKSKIGKQNKVPNFNSLIKAAAILIVATTVVLALQYNYQKDFKTEVTKTEVLQKNDSKTQKHTPSDSKKNEDKDETIKKKNEEEAILSDKTKINKSKRPDKKELPTEEKIFSEPLKKETNKVLLNPIKKESTDDKSTTSFSAFIRIDGNRCLNEEITLKADCDENGRDLDYIWTVNDKQIDGKNRKINVLLEREGNYDVHLQILDKKGKLLSHIENSFKVEPLPNIDFTYIDQKGILNDFEVVFEFKNHTNEKEIIWTIDNKIIKLTDNSTFDFGKAGVYDVKMMHVNRQGCTTIAEKPVAVYEDFKPLINAFTPNGDGKNDFFMPLGFDDFEGYFKFSVYQINGTLVYETTEPSKAWNGKRNNNGALMPEGNYIWKIEVRSEGKQRTFTDRVKLLIIK